MNIDYLTLACWKQELNQKLPARVQQVVQVTGLSIGMECYAGERFNLLLSAENQKPRVLLLPEKNRRGVEKQTPFLLQVKKLLNGALLTEVTQPPWERILRFHFQHGEESYTLVAELMGRYSNLILLDGGEIILEAIKRIPKRINRYREILPKRPYELPPVPSNRIPPEEVDWEYLFSRREEGQPLAKLLSSSLLAVSPTVAREIESRVGKNTSPDKLDEVFLELYSPNYRPSLGYDEEDRLVAFAPYPLTQCAVSKPVESINAAVLEYLTHGQPIDSYGEARSKVAVLVKDALERTEHRVEQMRAQAVKPEKIDQLRENGQLLLTYQYLVHKGMTEVEVTDYAGEPRKITLEPRLSPSENAQAYFMRYDKALRANEGLPQRLAAEENELEFLRQLEADILIASSRPQIDAVYNALVDGGWVREKKRPRMPQGGPLRVESGDWLIWVGRSAAQNEQVTFKIASPEDLWLHVHDKPGAHVLIKGPSQEVPQEIIEQAAQLAAYYSSARNDGGVQVDVTKRKFVRSIPGAHKGLVTYRESESVWLADAAAIE
ncbi:MAG: NFACT RNA binding domain-containing protein [Anaerolineae bacterium]|jgi:predicted ribosome quality control (RQC) complex YloA/Tae2 family protein|nr:NFACT RNA binding domain-containing protein [Anaerolineae bacterium]